MDKLTNPICKCGEDKWEEATMNAWLFYNIEGFKDGYPVYKKGPPEIHTDGAEVEIRCMACGEPLQEEV